MSQRQLGGPQAPWRASNAAERASEAAGRASEAAERASVVTEKASEAAERADRITKVSIWKGLRVSWQVFGGTEQK